MKAKKLISFVFPIYNEQDTIAPLYRTVKKIAQQLSKNYNHELLFIDDGSLDDSLERLKKLAQEDGNVTIVHFSRNFGHQAAVTAGLETAEGDAVIIMDADLQDPPEVCLELVQKWAEGYEVVYAQRRSRQDGLFKRVSASAYYWLLSRLAAINIPRNTGDFRLVDRKVVDVVCDMKEYNRFLRGMFSFVGFKQIAVPFDRHARHAGVTKYPFKKMVHLAKDGILGFSDVPLRLITRLGFFVSFMSVLGIIYALILKLFFTSVTVPGWTMITVAIFFMGGVQLLVLGVIGEYIGRIYNEVRGRPRYIVSEVIRGKS